MSGAEAFEHLSVFFAQRDDARDAGDHVETAYWRGYIDAVCDIEGIDDDAKAAAESVYQQTQAFAAETLAAVAAQHRAA